jgi:hypothetical protein
MKEFIIMMRASVQDHDEDVISSVPQVIEQRFIGTAVSVIEVAVINRKIIEERANLRDQGTDHLHGFRR